MSLLTTASPYHSREDGSGIKGGKKVSNRRKATMPSLSASISEAKNYMTQLIQNKEPQPSLSSYNGTPINEFYSYQPSGISDMLYPTLEDTSSKNSSNDSHSNHTKEGAMDDPLQGEELLRNNGALPLEEIPSYYKKNKTQQNGITSALQKLTGSSTITQEGMTDYSSSSSPEGGLVGVMGNSILGGNTYAASSSQTKRDEHGNSFEPPYIPTMPAFTLNQQPGGGGGNRGNVYNSPSPIDYLASPSNNIYSEYQTSYSDTNYVVPPNLSHYSYPIMRTVDGRRGAIEDSENQGGDRTQQVLLEKINYMIYLLEQQKKEKSKHTSEEFVLYSFLGVFVIYLADSFARSGRYIR